MIFKSIGGHVARMGEMEKAYNILVGKPEKEDYLEDLGTDGKILELILGKWGKGKGKISPVLFFN
jgi:hypothetical protein